ATGCVRAHGLACAAHALLRGVPARPDGSVAAMGREGSALARAVCPGRPGPGGGGADPFDPRAGRPRDAVDRRMGAREPPGSDPAVLPHRLYRLGAWPRG